MDHGIDPIRLADLQARFAAVGCELIRPKPTDWRAPLYVLAHNMTRTFSDLDQVAAFLPQVGGSLAQRTWPDAKAFETGRAEVALQGGTLLCLDDDRGRLVLIVTRGAETRKFTSLDEVQVWAESAS